MKINLNKITNCFICLAVIFILWVLVSFIDTVSHNQAATPAYQTWNFFSLFFS